MASATQVTSRQRISDPSGTSSAAPAHRRAARVAGALFIAATVASVVGAVLTPALTGADYLARLSAHPNQAAAGAFFYVVAALASAGIAVSLYPILRETGVGLALGAVVFRALEGAMYLVAVVALLSLVTLGEQPAFPGAVRAGVRALGDALVGLHDHASLLGVFAFCLGAALYYVSFYRSRLIPRWLSGWGLAAIVLMLAACMMALFADAPVTGYVPLALPIAAQEIVLAVWLIVRGPTISPPRGSGG